MVQSVKKKASKKKRPSRAKAKVSVQAAQAKAQQPAADVAARRDGPAAGSRRGGIARRDGPATGSRRGSSACRASCAAGSGSGIRAGTCTLRRGSSTPASTRTSTPRPAHESRGVPPQSNLSHRGETDRLVPLPETQHPGGYAYVVSSANARAAHRTSVYNNGGDLNGTFRYRRRTEAPGGP